MFYMRFDFKGPFDISDSVRSDKIRVDSTMSDCIRPDKNLIICSV